MNSLTSMIQLLGEVPLSTAVAEELHAPAALVSRLHTDCAVETLHTESMVLIARMLLPMPTMAQQLLGKLETSLQRTRRHLRDSAVGRYSFGMSARQLRAGARRPRHIGAR